MEPKLEYKYDDYAEDFDNEDMNDKNKSPLTVDIQVQASEPEER